jgi:hypothetical protein
MAWTIAQKIIDNIGNDTASKYVGKLTAGATVVGIATTLSISHFDFAFSCLPKDCSGKELLAPTRRISE